MAGGGSTSSSPPWPSACRYGADSSGWASSHWRANAAARAALGQRGERLGRLRAAWDDAGEDPDGVRLRPRVELQDAVHDGPERVEPGVRDPGGDLVGRQAQVVALEDGPDPLG